MPCQNRRINEYNNCEIQGTPVIDAGSEKELLSVIKIDAINNIRTEINRKERQTDKILLSLQVDTNDRREYCMILQKIATNT